MSKKNVREIKFSVNLNEFFDDYVHTKLCLVCNREFDLSRDEMLCHVAGHSDLDIANTTFAEKIQCIKA